MVTGNGTITLVLKRKIAIKKATEIAIGDQVGVDHDKLLRSEECVSCQVIRDQGGDRDL